MREKFSFDVIDRPLLTRGKLQALPKNLSLVGLLKALRKTARGLPRTCIFHCEDRWVIENFKEQAELSKNDAVWLISDEIKKTPREMGLCLSNDFDKSIYTNLDADILFFDGKRKWLKLVETWPHERVGVVVIHGRETTAQKLFLVAKKSGHLVCLWDGEKILLTLPGKKV